MEQVRIVQGTAVPLDRSDVDTDQIIPSDWLKRVERTGFEKGLFSEWRDDPSFVMNDERFAGASILVAGSQLRHRLVTRARGVGDPTSGVRGGDLAAVRRHLPQQLDEERSRAGRRVRRTSARSCCEAIETDPTLELTIDVDRRTLEAPAIGLTVDFPLDDAVRHRFLEGLDDIGITMQHERRHHDLRVEPSGLAPGAGPQPGRSGNDVW